MHVERDRALPRGLAPALWVLYLAWSWLTLETPPLMSDEGWYGVTAYDALRTGRFSNSLFTGYHGYEHDFPVHGRLLTYAQVAALRLLGPGPRAERLPSALAGAVLVLLLYRWARSRYGARLALAAAAALALHPLAAIVFHLGRPDALLAAFFLGAVLTYEHARETARPAAFFAAGALAGLAFDAHPNAALLVVLLAVWTVSDGWRGRRRWQECALVFVGMALGGLWWAATHMPQGWAAFRDALGPLYAGKADPATWGRPIAWTRRWYLLEFWTARPIRLAELALAAGGAGAMLASRRGATRRPALVLFGGALLAAVPFGSAAMQHAGFLLAPLVLVSVWALATVAARRPRLGAVLVTAYLAALGAQQFASVARCDPPWRRPFEAPLAAHRDAYLAAVRAAVPAGAVTLATPVHLGAFLDGTLRSSAAVDYETIDRRRRLPPDAPAVPGRDQVLRDWGVEYLVIDPYLRAFWLRAPELRLFLERRCEPVARLACAREFAREVPAGGMTVVYRVRR